MQGTISFGGTQGAERSKRALAVEFPEFAWLGERINSVPEPRLLIARMLIGQGFGPDGAEVKRALGCADEPTLGVMVAVTPTPAPVTAPAATASDERTPRRRNRRATASHAGRVRRSVARELDERAEREPRELREYSDLIEAGHLLSERDFRRVRAAIADRSSARNLLWLLGADQAARYAPLDLHQPHIRRAVVVHYALDRTRAREGLAGTIRAGVGRAFLCAISADPRNPNLRRENGYRPSVTTMSHTLALIEEIQGYDFTRWQAPHDETHSCEWLPGARHPTNRYYLPHTSSHRGLTELLAAFGAPAVTLRELRTRRASADAREADEAREACAELAQELGAAESVSAAPEQPP